MSTSFARAMLVLMAICFPAAADTGPTWPQWRGPHRDGTSEGPAWPDDLDDQTFVPLWRVELGPGYSGPIVHQGAVFTAETVDREREVVRALDRRTGAEIWRAEWPGALSVPFFAKSNGDWIRSTPAVDADSLYVAGMRDVLVCLEVNNGKERWRIDFSEKLGTPLPSFGFVSSPLVHEQHVYVQAGASVVKLEKQTGRIVWRTLQDGGGMYGSAFSSPVLAEIAGSVQLAVQTRSKLAGIDPRSGRVLWSQEVPAFRGMNILTPTIFDDAVFTSAYGGRSHLFKLARSDGDPVIREAWNNKIQAYMSSPIVVGKHCYLHLRNQRFASIDLETGKENWITRQRFGKYWSMVARRDRILALDEAGVLRLIHADPSEFRLLAERKISDEETWGHLAISEGDVFVRELHAIAVYRWRAAPRAQTSAASAR